MTSQIVYDLTGDNLHRLTIPPLPFAIGGYINGAITKFIWTRSQWREFRDSYHIRINVTGAIATGNCLDVENGDATPAHVAPWINSLLGSPDPLLVYCNRSNLDAVIAARALTKWHGKVFLWVATLDGTVIPTRSMTQFGQFNDAQGAYADVSVIINESLIKLMSARIGHQ